MAVTQNSYTQSGDTTKYAFTFPYLKASEVKVSIDATVTTAFDLFNATTVQLNTAPASGAKIKIYRETDTDTLAATFYAGSAIKSEDLNDNFTQNLHTTQEVNARYLSNLGGTMVGDMTMAEDVDIIFEGATDDGNETRLTVEDPTADRVITLPDHTGNVIVTGKADQITSTELAPNSVDSSELADGSIDLSHMSANSVDSDQYVDGSIDHVHLSNNLIDGDNIQDDVINSEHYVAGSIDLEHMSANSVDSDQYVDGSIDRVHLEADIIDSTKLADNSVNSEHIVAGSVDLAHMSANSVDSDQYVDGSIDRVHLSADIIDSTKIADDAVTTDHLQDPELTTLAGMPTATASALADSTALDVSTTEINRVVKNKYVETSITNSDNAYPTSGAVIDYVAAQIAPLGGLEVIANEDSFPTQPASGVVISIADAGGIVVNGSGVSTTARTSGNGSDNVTINGFPSTLHSTTLADSMGLLVSSTGSSNTYTYHKLLGKEDDIKNLSDDINDFNARYRIASSAPSSNNDDGDLYFDTSSKKMKVYNASTSQWDDVASSSSSYIVTLSESFDNSRTSFTMSTSAVDAQSTIVSINGVIQKPNAGTSQPSEGFAINGNQLVLSAAPPTNSTSFVVVLGDTVSIGTPSDNTVSSNKIQNLAVITGKIANDAVNQDKIADDAVGAAQLASNAVVNASVDASAAIAGTKVAPDFGSQNIVTTGQVQATAQIPAHFKRAVTGTSPVQVLIGNNTRTWALEGHSTKFSINDYTAVNVERLSIDENGKIGIGTTSPLTDAELTLSAASDPALAFQRSGSGKYDAGILVSSGHFHFKGGADSTTVAGLNNLMTIKSDGKVGIGTTDPEDLLHIKSGKIRIENAIVSNNDSTISYDNTDFLIDVDPNNVRGSSQFQVKIDTVAGLTIDDSRNVGIGTTDPARQLEVNSDTANTFIRIKSSDTGNAGLEFGDQSDTVQSAIYHNSDNNYLIINGYNNASALWIDPSKNVHVVDGDLKIATNGHGIDFSSTADGSGASNVSEILNDYEQGTFTPSISSTCRSGTITYTNAVGFYTKIGNRVFGQVYMNISGGTNTANDFIVDGLPYSCVGTASHEGGGYHTYMGPFFTAEADRQNTPWVGLGANYVKFYDIASGSTIKGNDTSTSSNYLIFHVQYEAA